MNIDEFYEVCEKIQKEGRALVEIVDKDGTKKKVYVKECLRRTKQFIREEPDTSWINFRDAVPVNE